MVTTTPLDLGSSTLSRSPAPNVMSLSRVVRLVRPDGEVYRWTDHDRVLYLKEEGSEFGYSPEGAPETTSRRAVVALEAEGDGLRGFIGDALSNALTVRDVLAGRWDRSQVDVYTVNWRAPFLPPIHHRRYWLHDIAFSAEEWQVQLRGLAGQIQVLIGRIYNRKCDAVLGDARCGIDLELPDWKDTDVVVVDVLGLAGGDHPRLKFRSDITWRTDKFFKHGRIVWTVGNNVVANQSSFDVRAYTHDAGGGIFELWVNTPEDIEVGDEFSAYAGCGKHMHKDCRVKFDNIANFRGFPYLPSWRKIIKGPNAVK